MNLIKNSAWEYQLIRGGASGEWFADPLDCCRDLPGAWRQFSGWPVSWRLYGKFVAHGPWTMEPCLLEVDPASSDWPESIHVQNKELPGRDVAPDANGVLDLSRIFGDGVAGSAAYVFGRFHLDEARRLSIHAGADWWMQWWMDGRPLGDTLQKGNHFQLQDVAHLYSVSLDPGWHLVGARILAGSTGWRVVSEATVKEKGTPPERLRFSARRLFEVTDPERFTSLTLVNAGDHPPQLNGRSLARPLADMRYRDWSGIPAKLLRNGANRLTREWAGKKAFDVLHTLALRRFCRSGELPDIQLPSDLTAFRAEDVTLQTGPVLGWADEHTFTLACRTTGILPVVLEVEGGIRVESPPGVLHGFSVGDFRPGQKIGYRLRAGEGPARNVEGRELVQGRLRTISPESGYTVGVVGDPSPSPERFERVMAALADQRPDILLLLGDLTSNGREDCRWDSECFGRVPDLFRTTPTLAVRGNHEDDSVLFDHLFLSPSGTPNWALTLGVATWIGIDGALDWAPESEGHRWLDQTLKNASTPFIFLANHYPAYSSAGHGQLAADGLPLEAAMRACRQYILPLAVQHRVTAMFHGHEHGYERSEFPGGLTSIISAGGGGRVYQPIEGKIQNPFSVCNVPAHHFGLLRVTPEEVRWEALSLDGISLDQSFWCPSSSSPKPCELEVS
ncbi:MAG: metallophosphoesterase [Verrucomicrobia bacterium]|nr:metallophosphoesterase [Verrucomicrobiota bacterium]MCH8511172.1 metallophosphoesterase [Kiritimatiellia bacterium]